MSVLIIKAILFGVQTRAPTGYVWPTCKNVSRHAKVPNAEKALQKGGVRRTCRIGGLTCKIPLPGTEWK